MKLIQCLALVAMSSAQLAHGQIQIADDSVVSFASLEEGTEILASRDDFVCRLSAFDRAARLKTDKEVSEEEYLSFAKKNVLEWNETEMQHISTVVNGVASRLKELDLPLPPRVLIIKTTGKEEGGAAYTRANGIVFPEKFARSSVESLKKTFCHELFHIISRKNPALRDKCYAAIGFEKCDEVGFPSELASRKLTNPDAPKNDHCIRLDIGGDKQWVIPVLFSREERYNVTRGGEFFSYLDFQFLVVDRASGSTAVKARYASGKAVLVGMSEVSGFFEQVGKNTRYIIHPEEILADNFSYMVLERRNLPSPEIIEKLRRVFLEHGD